MQFISLPNLYFFIMIYNSNACNAGQWPSNGKCYECPPNFKCTSGLENPIICPPETTSLESSAACCPKSTKCPLGFAVDSNNECTCSSIRCPKGQSLMSPSSSKNFQCQASNKCEPCAVGMVQTPNCYCFRVNDICSKKGSGSAWKSGSGAFSCLFT